MKALRLIFAIIGVSGGIGGCTRDQLRAIFPAEIEKEDRDRMASAQTAGATESPTPVPTTEPVAAARSDVTVAFPSSGRMPVTIIDGDTGMPVDTGFGDMGEGAYGEEER